MALNHPDWIGTVPQIAQVIVIPPEFPTSNELEVVWMETRRTPNTTRWKRSYYLPAQRRQTTTTAHVNEILLYNFVLNAKRQTLKKVTSDELKRLYAELAEQQWNIHPEKRTKL